MCDSATSYTVVLQAPLSMGFSGQEDWSGLPLPSPRKFSDPGIKPALAGGFFTWEAQKALKKVRKSDILRA